MSLASRYRCLVPLGAFAVFLLVSGAGMAQVANTIDLTSSRDSLRADGYSRAVISAAVRDRSGRLVPDGTEIRFSTTLGIIDQIAMTQAGTARVSITSAAVPGVATIVATSGQALNSRRIVFLAQGQAEPTRPNVIPIEAQYIAYSAETRIIEAIGRVTVHLGKGTLLADRVQLNTMTSVLVAESAANSPGLTLTDGKTTWLAHRFNYNWHTASGLIQDDTETYGYVGPPFLRDKTIETGKVPAGAFQMIDLEDETEMWITAKRVALFPDQRIHFRNAVIRPAGKKILSLPYYSLPLSTVSGIAEQFVGLGTQGVTLDLPYYLRLGDTSATSLRFGWNKPEGSYGVYRPGFGLDLQQRIFIGERGEETVNLSRFTSPDWGIWYKHVRNWSNTFQTSAYVDYPDHRDLFAAGNAYYQAKEYTAALSASSSKTGSFTPSYLADLALETRPVALGRSGWRYSLISTTGFTTSSFLNDFRQSVLLRATLPSWRWGRGSTSTATITGGEVLAGQFTGFTSDAVYSVNHQFGRQTNLGLNYTYYNHPGQGSLTSKHRVGANFFAGKGKTFLATTLSQTLDGRSTSLINDLTYQLNPQRGISVGVRYIYFSYAGFPYSDQSYSVTYPLFNRPFTLYWSKQQHRFLIEFAQVAF